MVSGKCKWCGERFTKPSGKGGYQRRFCNKCGDDKRNLIDRWKRVIGRVCKIVKCKNRLCDRQIPVKSRSSPFCSDSCYKLHVKTFGTLKSTRSAQMCRNCGSVCYKTKEQMRRSSEVFCDLECANEHKKLSYVTPRWKEKHAAKYGDNDPMLAQMRTDRQEFIDKALMKGWKCCVVCDGAFMSGVVHARTCSEACSKALEMFRRGYSERVKTCPECGNSYEVRSRANEGAEKQKFCSKRCCKRSVNRGRRQLSHIQRAKKAGSKWEKGITLRSLSEEHGMTCYICGCECVEPRGLNLPNEATIEHVVPIALGGSHTRDNCRIACRDCNTKKGTKLMRGKQYMLSLN